MYFHAVIPSPLGPVLLRSDGASLLGLYFVGQRDCPDLPGAAPMRPAHFDPAAGELDGRPMRTFKVRRRDPSGDLFEALAATDVTADDFDGGALELRQADTPESALAVFRQTRLELSEYVHGRRRIFDIPLAPEGTPFQKTVWKALLEIPLGQTVSYGELARMAGLGTGHGRAVGAAVGHNPISIIIPCHRVLAAGGALNGYSGGLDRKARLLEIEGFVLQ
ncbi:methylated-DNA--[protein]-cysteine S-methyltransferase [Castellaniella sp. GW247-6E4]|uniref:methylated-DNA--[protein]-cysteine S-methyltransferase n=1 Tax=Castellaniella sp. GW247-6E4 TaxID=3140380 RepID=UPI00331531E5